ncbi:DUF4381 family protein [Luteimonas aquatica]|uniref:DUF4381 family protein n=1 Tax=Luteimonas aquatica TaxID=450364 RepID=UPI001F584D4F|nr:DUF4381 family protein [Luteimonas aquatica]
MQAADSLVLRDIHQPVAPPWWPPAPGWWLVAAVAAAALALLVYAWLKRHRRRRAVLRLFDETLRAREGEGAAAQVAAMSELLRRAARRRDPAADTLEGEAWLSFLDGADGGRSAFFSEGAGRLLLDGGFRRALDEQAVRELRVPVRKRYLELMAVRR